MWPQVLPGHSQDVFKAPGRGKAASSVITTHLQAVFFFFFVAIDCLQLFWSLFDANTG